MKIIITVFITLIFNTSAIAANENWWLLNAGKEKCQPAAQLSPEALMHEFPECEIGDSENPNLLIFNCEKSDLKTNIVYVNGPVECQKALKYFKEMKKNDIKKKKKS